ncbi:hypothetical protein D3C86_2137160 [compost metagenome]
MIRGPLLPLSEDLGVLLRVLEEVALHVGGPALERPAQEAPLLDVRLVLGVAALDELLDGVFRHYRLPC